MGVKKSFYDNLCKNGGFVSFFLMIYFNFLDFWLNYCDYCKIVVIDGQIGYVGGFNVGDQYLGWLKKFGLWCDIYLRI